MHNRTKWTLAGLAIGSIFLWLALREANLSASWVVLLRTDPLWAFVVFAAGVGFMAVKTLRWSRILRPLTCMEFGTLHSAVYVGTAANLVVAHTGEIVRATLISRKGEVASSAVLATIAVERILDFVALLVVTGVALVWDPSVSPLLLSAGFLSLGFVIAGILGVLAFLNPTPLFRRLGHTVLSPLPSRARGWLVDQLQRGVKGLDAVRDARALVKVLALSLLQWSCIIVAIWASARAVGVPVEIPAAIAVFVLTVIGLTLPSSPAQLGTTQLAFVVGLELAGAGAAEAFAASLVYTLFVVVAMMVLGVGCWILFDWPRGSAERSKA